MSNMLIELEKEGYMGDDKRKKFRIINGKHDKKTNLKAERNMPIHKQKKQTFRDASFIKDKVADIGVGLVIALIVGGLGLYIQYQKVDVQLSGLNDSLEKIEGNIQTFKEDWQNDLQEVKNDLKTDISQINDDVDGIEKNMTTQIFELNKSVARLEGRMATLQLSRKVLPEERFQQYVALTYESDSTVQSPPASNIEDSTVIATDMITNESCTDTDLQNETIVLAYTENDEEVFFKGQFDEQMKWNDHCIINRYKDNNLVMIMEAEYQNGELKRYKQVFPYINTSGTSVWAISERETRGNSNSGYTKTYFRTANNEVVKSFDIESFEDADIIDVESFSQRFNMLLEGYYNGYTSNGLFNDISGNSYMIKYDKYGYVRMLYIGGIVNGQPEDSTNNGWYIVREENTAYMYYKGIFENGHPVNNLESITINPLSIEQREEFLRGKVFDSILDWYTDI